MKILWHSARVSDHTGYGVQTKNFIRLLKQDGHTVGVVSMVNDGSPAMAIDGVVHLPGGWKKSPVTNGDNGYGWQGIVEYAKRGQPDLIITLMDLWALPLSALKEIQSMGIPWMAYGPVDHDPIPLKVLERFQLSPYPMAMSLFGKEQLESHGIKNVHYFPHGVDIENYKPGKKDKRIFGLDDNTFVVGTVATNIDPFLDRKGFQQSLEAFSILNKKHPDTAYYLHTEATGQWGGLNLTTLGGSLGIKLHIPDAWQLYTGEFFDSAGMARIYNAFDVFMLLSKGEGFGIPLIEAQACGIPVITTDWTAQKDLVGSGWKIPVISKKWTLNDSYYATADAEKAAEALEEAYDNWKRIKSLTESAKARKFAEDFDFKKVYETYLKPVLKEIESAPRHVHDWSVTGLRNEDGTISAFCYKCNDELVIDQRNNQSVIKDGFKPTFDFQEPDHRGVVGKIIAREIVRDYDLTGLDVQEGDAIVDIGAHIGLVTKYIAEMYPQAKVYAYEPVKENYEYLLKNTAGLKNVVTHNLAVTKDGRDVSLGGDMQENTGGSSIYNTNKFGGAKSISVPDLMAEVGGKIKLLKIDAEFAEYEILPAMDLTKVEYLRGEFHSGADFSPEQLATHCNQFIDPKKTKVSVS